MRKKILYVVTKSEPFGGVQRYVYDLAVSLPKDRFDVVVALGGTGLLKKKLDESGIRTVHIPDLQRDISASKEVSSFFFLMKLVQEEKPHILHLNSSKAGGLGSLVGRLRGVPTIVFTAHGWAFNESRSDFQKKVFKFLHWITILLAHHTIAPSKKTANDVLSFPFTRRKITVLYNGLRETTFETREKARSYFRTISPLLSAFIGRKKSKYVIFGMTSELHRNKGIDVALTAFKEIVKERTDVALVIAGQGEERVNLETLIQNLGLKDRVFMLGPVTDVCRYLKAYDVFLMPSRTETLPYSVIEAGFAGLPVIASRVGGIPEIVEDKETGVLVPPNNPFLLREAMKEYLKDPKTFGMYGTALKLHVEATFTLDTMVEKTIQLYEGNLDRTE